jgi:hypothetical protein
MGMGELHESIGGTINYYKVASCCFGQHYQGLLLVVLQITPKLPHMINSILSKCSLSFLL